MHVVRRLSKPISTLLLPVFLLAVLPQPAALAAMIGTDGVFGADSADEKAAIADYLHRSQVRAELERLGVAPGEVAARLDALTPAEAAVISRRIAELPAGGNASAIVFLLLLFLAWMDWKGFSILERAAAEESAPAEPAKTEGAGEAPSAAGERAQ